MSFRTRLSFLTLETRDNPDATTPAQVIATVPDPTTALAGLIGAAATTPPAASVPTVPLAPPIATTTTDPSTVSTGS